MNKEHRKIIDENDCEKRSHSPGGGPNEWQHGRPTVNPDVPLIPQRATPQQTPSPSPSPLPPKPLPPSKPKPNPQ